ncbi:unnamed protein product, partial [marine sediment metagenome]
MNELLLIKIPPPPSTIEDLISEWENTIENRLRLQEFVKEPFLSMGL